MKPDLSIIADELTKSQIIARVLEKLPMPAVLVAFGLRPVPQQSCPNPRHPNNGGTTGTAFCVSRHTDKLKWMFHCHNVECGIHGDVIDLYRRLAGWLFHVHREVDQTARFLFEAVQEGVFDLSIRELESQGFAHRKHGTQQLSDDPIRQMWRQLRSIKPDERLIKSIRTVLTLKSFGSFSVRSLCEILLSGYPDDSWMMASSTKGGYKPQKKGEWLSDKRLCKQSYVYPICFRERRAFMENCLARQWAIIEFDSIGKEYQASLLFHLAEKFPKMPLQLIVDSQNKSLHGWFSVSGISQAEYFELFKLARKLGCDPQTIWPELRCRMANGWNHKTKTKQKVVWMSEEMKEKLLA